MSDPTEIFFAHLSESLGRMEGKLDTVISQVAGHEPRIDALADQQRDLDNRVRSLEADKWKLAGGAALIGGVVAILAVVLPLSDYFLG